uniref:Major facilitator superfamily associated domain-containing protein n=1 Tax=Attheya septentrionalis TaxID=420275 RepID=A0A7S2UAR2_9STRA|mmetsp:Transcript_17729/g.32052  ORF Transcript_17729/g.32052 Transcript_17729/m.32052 type:complete len:469 (+) Transcript_17729:444-1850(+)
MRPGHLYNALFIWLVWNGGRFTATFLKDVAHFSDTLVGLTFAIQVCISALLSPLWGSMADKLELRYPHRGRAFMLGSGVLLATSATLLHSVVEYLSRQEEEEKLLGIDTKIWHMILRVFFAIGQSAPFPVLDGMTLAFLEEEGSSQADFGKERLYGAVGWAIASIILGPFIDIFGFEVIFGFALISLAYFFITLRKFAIHVLRNASLKGTSNTDGTQMTELSHSPKGSEEIQSSDKFLQKKSIQINPDSEEDEHRPLVSNLHSDYSMLSFLIVMFGTLYGAGFMLSSVTLAMGMSIVESLIFLYFQELGGSNLVMGLSVVVTVMFEIPIFHYAPNLLQRFGPGKLQQIACVAYVLRVIGYTLIPENHLALVLFLEPLHGITYGCAKTSSVEYAARLSPKGYESTGQGLLATLTGIGSVVGLAVGGWTEQIYGAQEMYRGCALTVSFGLLIFSLANFIQGDTIMIRESS